MSRIGKLPVKIPSGVEIDFIVSKDRREFL